MNTSSQDGGYRVRLHFAYDEDFEFVAALQKAQRLAYLCQLYGIGSYRIEVKHVERGRGFYWSSQEDPPIAVNVPRSEALGRAWRKISASR